ncbi:hypothetical protein D3P09_21925 [Paenibacillus pinisoli]|uniref:DUF5625 domain-containing protein n=1 Tax=Paenibacillus pinisoli TaxID=1276110 RepID=A0A3A6PD51_9BACL|nr:hypothetical protein [Paenibacillus pinisoli]RJX37636.1 hypothetical protein D3P09_21925 [Paenibacillus pinisoli]
MNNKKAVLAVLALILILAAGFYAYESTTTVRTVPDDIKLEATVMANTNPNMDYDYMLEISLTQDNDSAHLMYPIISGINRLSYDAKDEELGYFLPTNIALVDKDEPRMMDALTTHNLLYWEKDTFYGIWAPVQKGTYKLRAYFNSDQKIEQWEDAKLLYVHSEEGWVGNDMSWSKLIDVRVHL